MLSEEYYVCSANQRVKPSTGLIGFVCDDVIRPSAGFMQIVLSEFKSKLKPPSYLQTAALV